MKMRYPLVAAALLAAGAILFLLKRPVASPVAPPAPSAMVDAARLSRQLVPLRIDGAGSVVAGLTQTDVTLAAPGIIAGFNVRPGQAVAAGQALAEITPDAQSIATLHKAQDAVDAAGAGRLHVAALLAQHLATNADLAAASQIMRDAAADLAALRATGAGSQRAIAAPFAGIVTAISASPGSLLPAGTTLLRIAPNSDLRVQGGLAEADALQVRPGDTATMTLLNTGAQLPAKVIQRAAMLDPQTGLMNVALLPAGDVTLGEPVAFTITAGNIIGFRVPRAAVLSDAQGDYVYLLDPANIAHRNNVRVLESDSADSVLAPTLDAGMRVATTGAYQLADGMTATLQGSTP